MLPPLDVLRLVRNTLSSSKRGGGGGGGWRRGGRGGDRGWRGWGVHISYMAVVRMGEGEPLISYIAVIELPLTPASCTPSSGYFPSHSKRPDGKRGMGVSGRAKGVGSKSRRVSGVGGTGGKWGGEKEGRTRFIYSRR